MQGLPPSPDSWIRLIGALTERVKKLEDWVEDSEGGFTEKEEQLDGLEREVNRLREWGSGAALQMSLLEETVRQDRANMIRLTRENENAIRALVCRPQRPEPPPNKEVKQGVPPPKSGGLVPVPKPWTSYLDSWLPGFVFGFMACGLLFALVGHFTCG